MMKGKILKQLVYVFERVYYMKVLKDEGVEKENVRKYVRSNKMCLSDIHFHSRKIQGWQMENFYIHIFIVLKI